MAILWPTGSTEQSRTSGVLRRALGHAVTLVEGGAGVLALPDDGEGDGSGAAWSDEPRVIAWGIERELAQRLIAVVSEDKTPAPLDGRPRALLNTDLWGGEIATLMLGDLSGAAGELYLLGPAGFSGRRQLNDPMRRQALIGELTAAVRLYQEAVRLRQENRQLSSILHFSGDGIITVDAALRITGFNPAMEAMTAWHQHEVLGRFYHDVLLPRDPQGTPLGYEQDPVVQAIETGRAVVDRDLVLLARDGQPVDVSLTVSAVRSPAGQLISCVINVRDITRSRESEELRNTFVSVVSHELQTPIAIIKGYASTLRREDAQWDEQTIRGRLEAIEEESDRLHHLVANLLQASRIQAGGLKMDPGPLDLAEMAQKVVRKFATRSPHHVFRAHFPENMPTVWADRERIEEVLLNLLDNAVKYSPNTKLIRVAGQVTGDEVIINVGDKGMGIPLREQARIFDRFQRVDNASSRTTQGAGLGLYICRAILDAHGGRIWVESELGKGSTFFFSLPRMEKAQLPMVTFGASEHKHSTASQEEKHSVTSNGSSSRRQRH